MTAALDRTVADRPPHVVLYDGECGLCDRFVQFTIAHDPTERFAFAALQSDLAAELLRSFGRSSEVVDRVYVVTDFESDEPELLERSDAALFVMRDVGWPWRALLALRIVPRVVRDWGYRLVAAIRHKLFKKPAACPVPDAATRRRFLA